MAKLKNIIKLLSENDYNALYDSLMDSGADKSGHLLKAMRERELSDELVMNELGVNSNAYYTLRSRLNQKIEEYLLAQMESPRTDILRKVANINEILFTKKRAIAIATLKKLEKELIDYDLSKELTIVYKALKKLHINTPEHFTYSQQYNRYVAYMLAVDKAEDLLSDYFKKYGVFIMTNDETDKLALTLLGKEMNNVCALYDSHRLFVYQSCLSIFHRLFVAKEVEQTVYDEQEPIEDVLDKVQEIFKTYKLDSLYFHLRLVFEFLTLEYYNHYRVFRKSEAYYEEVNESITELLTNYTLHTFPSQFLISKLHRALRMRLEDTLYEENQLLFQDYEPTPHDASQYMTYMLYRALSCYYAGKYEESAQWMNNMLNEISPKIFPYIQMEIKCLVALQYCLVDDKELFNQYINSVQRQMRNFGKENCEHIATFSKMLKTATSAAKKEKYKKITGYAERIAMLKIDRFSPVALVRLDEALLKRLGEED